MTGPSRGLAAAGLLSFSLIRALTAEPAAARQTWYMVDTPAVVCTGTTPPAPGEVNITVPLDRLKQAGLQNQPHVFTFYRTTKRATTVSFKVLDAQGRPVVGDTTVDLRELSRRLSAEDNLEARLRRHAGGAPPRILRGGHGGGRGGFGGHRGGGGFGGTRSSKFTSPRRRGGQSVGGARRRTGGLDGGSHDNGGMGLSSARRRGAATATHLPSSGVGGSHYHNAYGQPYGFTRPQTMNSYYPGGYAQTPYGYSGVNSYKPMMGSGMGSGNVMMAALGGAALGAGSMYMFSRFHSYDNCHSAGTWSGSCRSCYATYSPQACELGPPRVSAHRDDIMATGFWPDDWVGPLTVIISQVAGPDFSPAVLCPNVSSASSTLLRSPAMAAASGADLFFTLTQVDELARDNLPKSGFALGAVMPFILVCCCCLCAYVAGRVHNQFQNSKRHEHMSEEEEASFIDRHGFTVPGRHPTVMGVPMENVLDDDFSRPVGRTGGFMNTMAPSGISWRKHCGSHPVEVDPQTGLLAGAWGEALAWARVYEAEHPEWVQNPEYMHNGPCGQVLEAVEMTGDIDDRVVEAAEKLERACEVAVAHGKPLPLIHYTVGAE